MKNYRFSVWKCIKYLFIFLSLYVLEQFLNAMLLGWKDYYRDVLRGHSTIIYYHFDRYISC